MRPDDTKEIDYLLALQIIVWLQNQYDNKPGIFKFQATIVGVTLAIIVQPDKVFVFFEGTHDKPDIEHDFEAEMISAPELKGAAVHAGFFKGLIEAFAVILHYLPKNVSIYLCGHSLGAGRVNLAAGLLLYYGYTANNIFRVKFGSPNSNDMILEAMLRDSPCLSVWNYGDMVFKDPVGEVPLHCAIMGEGFPYFTKEKKVLVKRAPDLLDDWGPIIGWHHLTPNYYEGFKELCKN